MANYGFRGMSLRRKRRCPYKTIPLMFQALVICFVTFWLAFIVVSYLKKTAILNAEDNRDSSSHSICPTKIQLKETTIKKTTLFLLPMETHRNTTLVEVYITNYTSASWNFSLSSQIATTRAQPPASSEFLVANSNACNSSKKITLLVFVVSAPSHFVNRDKIRNSWGNESNFASVKTMFIVGESKNNSVQKCIFQEAMQHGDTVMGRFHDTYQNLTLKTISMLHWASLFCRNASFVLKTDDDMMINTKKLLEFLEANKAVNNTMFGHLAKNWKRHTDNNSKYYVPESEFNGTTYPDFLTGPAYLLKSDYIPQLYAAAVRLPYLRLEDVMITGLAANAAGIERKNVDEFLNTELKALDRCSLRKYISVHRISPEKQQELWSLLNDNISC